MQVEFGGEEGSITFHLEPDATSPVGVRCDRSTLKWRDYVNLVAEIDTTTFFDPATTHSELSAMLVDPALTGTTTVYGGDSDEFAMYIKLEQGRGTVSGQITSNFARDGEITFSLTTDQTFLTKTLHQLARITAEITAGPESTVP